MIDTGTLPPALTPGGVNHMMTVDAEGDCAFSCDGTTASDCHLYPRCECEYSCAHRRYRHAECYLSHWFSNPGDTREMYNDSGDWDRALPLDYRGPIDIEWDGECLYWSFDRAILPTHPVGATQ